VSGLNGREVVRRDRSNDRMDWEWMERRTAAFQRATSSGPGKADVYGRGEKEKRPRGS
jgi:hypothetical protein